MESTETLIAKASRGMFAEIVALAGSVLSAEEKTRIVLRFKGNRLEIEGDQVVAQRLLLSFKTQADCPG